MVESGENVIRLNNTSKCSVRLSLSPLNQQQCHRGLSRLLATEAIKTQTRSRVRLVSLHCNETIKALSPVVALINAVSLFVCQCLTPALSQLGSSRFEEIDNNDKTPNYSGRPDMQA